MVDPQSGQVISLRPAIRSNNRSLGDIGRATVDPVIAVGCLMIASLAWGHEPGLAEALLSALAFLLIYPTEISFHQRVPGFIRQISARWGLVVALLVLFGLSLDMIRTFDQNVLATWVIATPLAQIVLHWFAPLVLPGILAMRSEQVAVVVGASALGRALARRLAEDPFSQVRVTAFFDDRSADRIGSVTEAPLSGRVDTVADYVRANRTSVIYIALPMASQPRILKLLDSLRDTTASIYFVPDVFMLDIIQGRVDTIQGLPVVAVCDTPFHGTTGVIKRLADICISTVAIVLTLPLMLAIAAAIKLTMTGPILFRQRRYGLDGHEIVVWKFRTMSVLEDGVNVTQATRDDQRVTPLGRFLRRTSLDELPQFFNVIQGRMSVVGPRPHAVAHNETYRRLIKGYMVRHKVKPGITGLAQVSGARGETDTLEKMEARIRYDLEYLRQWSLRLDLWIIYRTIMQSFRDPNAY